MPPKGKGAAAAPGKKSEQKKKEKIIEDKTFGLKNKKGSKQQKYIKTVQHQVTTGGMPKQKRDQLNMPDTKEKDRKKQAQMELNALFKPVEQKVARGVDAKSVLCAFYKQGQCGKGDKCKFSHDLNIGRKGEKRSLYDDTRDENKEDNMEDWDEKKLEEVVNKKHGETNKGMPTTTIICKYFLEAVENNKYGWFWECPNGGTTCHYKHALPPGFVLKKDRKKEDTVDKISLEDLIERERAALSSANLTKVTLESFLKWKERKKREKKEKAMAAKEKKLADYNAGKSFGISGREMFEFNPDMVTADDEEADMDVTTYKQGSDDEEEYIGTVREINLEALAAEARENDGTGTSATSGRATTGQGATAKAAQPENEAQKMDIAGAPDPATQTDAAISAAMAATINGDALADDTPIDENLFDGEDLDLVEEELDTLELQD